jgi:uncharacterized membrane protein
MNVREHLVARTLQLGAYGSFALIVAGLLVAATGVNGAAEMSLRAGVLLLLATPAMRVIACLVMFAAGRETRYALVSASVLVIMALTLVFALTKL